MIQKALKLQGCGFVTMVINIGPSFAGVDIQRDQVPLGKTLNLKLLLMANKWELTASKAAHIASLLNISSPCLAWSWRTTAVTH